MKKTEYLQNRRRHDIITLVEGVKILGERLFDLDFQLMADSILMIIAVLFVAIIFIGIPVLIINLIKAAKRKRNCEDCPYKNLSEKAV